MAEEKIYNIPLPVKKKARVKRAPYAVSIVRDYLKRHTGTKEVKIGKYLNEDIWKRGTKKPPSSVRVRAVIDGGVVRAELLGFDYVDFVAKKREKKMSMRDKLMQRMGPKAIKKEEEEKKLRATPEHGARSAPVGLASSGHEGKTAGQKAEEKMVDAEKKEVKAEVVKKPEEAKV